MLDHYEPWSAGGVPLGFVRRDRLERLLAEGSPFRRTAGRIELRGEDCRERTALLAGFVAGLCADGEVEARGEAYPGVRAFGDAPLLSVDRGAVPWLGLRAFGVHLTGFVRKGRDLQVWVAVRARGRTWAGAWDNTVAGGQPAGLGLRANLAKECGEEAGIPAAVAARAVACGEITYVRADPTGLKPDTLFCYDLELDPAFAPRPCRVEVERFLCLPARDVADVVREEPRCKPNCSLVWIDFLLRHGVLDGELPQEERQRLSRLLRAPLP